MTNPSIPVYREDTNDGDLHVHFHPGQARAWRSTARFVSVDCGTGWGKTSFGPDWLEREIEERGPGDYLAVSATYPLQDLRMLPELQSLFEIKLRRFRYRAGGRVFESHEQRHGAPAYRIILGSAANPESLESAIAKAAWLDEAGQHQFTRQAWEAVLRRVALHRGRVLITTTVYEWGWHKTEVYDRWQAGDPDYEVIEGDSIDNPAFSREEYERARNTMPGWKFNMFYRGRYEKPAGLVYDAFDEAVCRIPRFQLPESWPRYVGQDFGTSNTAAVWFAHDPKTGYLYAYREYLEGGKSVYDHVNDASRGFKALSRGETILKRVGGSHQEEEIREAYRAAGWPVNEPRLGDVEGGIDIVYGWHKRNALFVFNDLVKYLDELQTYSRVLDENYQPTDIIENKSRFHLMDCTRYLLSDFGPERITTRRFAEVTRGYGERRISATLNPRRR